MLLEAQKEKQDILEQITHLRYENEEIEQEIQRQNERGWPKKSMNCGQSSNLISGLKNQKKKHQKQSKSNQIQKKYIANQDCWGTKKLKSSERKKKPNFQTEFSITKTSKK